MRYVQRLVLGIVLISVSFIVLWFGSPDRTGLTDQAGLFALAFVVIFAIGFILGSMGLLGMKDDYPALLSGLVLYFIVGALIAILLYMRRGGLNTNSLVEAGDASFWIYWIRVAATWPLELAQNAGLFGYDVLDLR